MRIGFVAATENAMTCNDHVAPCIDPTGAFNRALLTANLAGWRMMPQSMAPCFLVFEGNMSGFYRFQIKSIDIMEEISGLLSHNIPRVDGNPAESNGPQGKPCLAACCWCAWFVPISCWTYKRAAKCSQFVWPFWGHLWISMVILSHLSGPWLPPGGEPGGEPTFKVADLRHQSWTAMRPSTMSVPELQRYRNWGCLVFWWPNGLSICTKEPIHYVTYGKRYANMGCLSSTIGLVYWRIIKWCATAFSKDWTLQCLAPESWIGLIHLSWNIKRIVPGLTTLWLARWLISI